MIRKSDAASYLFAASYCSFMMAALMEEVGCCYPDLDTHMQEYIPMKFINRAES